MIGENVKCILIQKKELREFVETQGKGIRVEAMFKLTKVEW